MYLRYRPWGFSPGNSFIFFQISFWGRFSFTSPIEAPQKKQWLMHLYRRSMRPGLSPNEAHHFRRVCNRCSRYKIASKILRRECIVFLRVPRYVGVNRHTVREDFVLSYGHGGDFCFFMHAALSFFKRPLYVFSVFFSHGRGTYLRPR